MPSSFLATSVKRGPRTGLPGHPESGILAFLVGSRFGEILPAEGHLIRLAEPEEVNAEWKRWSCDLLKPEGLYPTRAAREKTKSAKLKAIAAALKGCDGVILATDCDREGQLIGQERQPPSASQRSRPAPRSRHPATMKAR
jgi:DNA topoisomerase IA